MDKEFWSSFLRFLEDASDDELQNRIEKTNRLLQRLRSAAVKADARRIIRLMEQELLARSQARALARPQ